MEIQFAALPVTFEFVREYRRWKGTSSAVMDFDDDQLNKTVSAWETDLFPRLMRITIVTQTRSLLGIRWKTPEGTRFSTDELNGGLEWPGCSLFEDSVLATSYSCLATTIASTGLANRVSEVEI